MLPSSRRLRGVQRPFLSVPFWRHGPASMWFGADVVASDPLPIALKAIGSTRRESVEEAKSIALSPTARVPALRIGLRSRSVAGRVLAHAHLAPRHMPSLRLEISGRPCKIPTLNVASGLPVSPSNVECWFLAGSNSVNGCPECSLRRRSRKHPPAHNNGRSHAHAECAGGVDRVVDGR